MSDERMIAALKRERLGYERRGLTERVAAVDEQLRFYGADVPEPEPATDPAGGPAGRTGKASRQRTAAADDGKPGATAK